MRPCVRPRCGPSVLAVRLSAFPDHAAPIRGAVPSPPIPQKLSDPRGASPLLLHVGLREALIKYTCGALQIFCTRILLQFLEINTIIPAKLRRILAQNLLQIALVDLISFSLNISYKGRFCKGDDLGLTERRRYASIYYISEIKNLEDDS